MTSFDLRRCDFPLDNFAKITEWLNPARSSALLFVFHVVIVIALVLMVRTLWRRRLRTTFSADRFLFIGFSCLFLAVYLYQAYWQLAGFRESRLTGFMRRYTDRPSGDAPGMLRGRIVDRNGVPLAANAPGGARGYPLGEAAAHLVGYNDPFYGLAGLERCADGILTGRALSSLEAVGRFGRNVFNPKSLRGGELKTTLDKALQRDAYERMAGRAGAIIVMDPREGSILAMVSSPSYDPVDLARTLASESGAPMLNRALQGRYPPGSTFKMVVAALAVDAGLTGTRACPAEGFRATSRARPIRDHEYYAAKRAGRVWAGHGNIGMPEALIHSSNVFFAQLGCELGGKGLREGAHGFWVGRPIPIYRGPSGSLESNAGSLPTLTAASRRATAQVAIGQGTLLVTPLHVALMASAIATDGVVRSPRLLKSQISRAWGRACSPRAAETVRAMMREVVISGTGARADISGLKVAGKTGTAQAAGGDDHAWFVCMAPYDAPKIVAVVLVERGGYGSAAALPVAKALLKHCERLGYLGESE